MASLWLTSLADASAPASWRSLAHDVAVSWSKLQNRNGTFRDYVYGGDVSFCYRRRCRPGLGNARYAESVLGYAMIETGLREHDTHLVGSGLRAINYIVAHRRLQRTLPTNFESSSVAAAYNTARRRLPHRPLFAKHRRAWENWMRHVKPQWIGHPRPYFNHTLVEAISNLELFRTGLRSRVRGAVLNPRIRSRQARLTRAVINRTIPHVAGKTRRSSRGVGSAVLSDAPDYPLAYHGFSLGLYARAVDLMGRRASSRSRALLRRLSNASWLLAGPDGDVAYTGRSQEEVWALTSTAFGAEYTAHLGGTHGGAPARFEAVANRTVARVRNAYGIGPKGLWIVPALTVDPVRGLRAVDPYAGAAAFGGLTLVELEWAIDAARGRRAPGRIAADHRGAAKVMRGDDTTTLVRSGDLWYAVRQASSFDRHEGDLRWDFGLVAFKQLIGGVWRYVQPLRPTTSGKRATSAGPLLLLRSGGVTGVPYGLKTRVAGRATTVSGGFRAPHRNGRWVRRGVRFGFKPAGCGMRLTFPARKGDSIEYSAFMRGSKRAVSIGARRVTDASQAVSFDHPARVTLEGGYSSGSDPALVRARLHFKAPAAEKIAVTVCAR